MAGYNMNDLRARTIAALNQDQGRGLDAEDFYLQAARQFDPTAYVDRAATGAFNTFRRDLDRAIGDYRGSAVGMGRLDTGFATEDEDRITTELGQRLADTLAQNSLQAAGLYQRNIEGIGEFGARQRERYLEELAGVSDRAQAEENAKKKRKGGLFGTIGTVLGAGAGAFLGNPVLGAELGGMLGNAAGQYL